MPARTTAVEDGRWREVSPRTLQRWRQLVRDLPDVRMDRVRAIREALKGRKYDSEEVLDETVRRLRNEIGILCRCKSQFDAS